MNALQESISKCKVEGNQLILPTEILENYADVRKALMAAGAKYQRGKFVFPAEAQSYIDRIMSGDKNIKKTFQFFPTPTNVAQMMIDQISFFSEARVLEPSAGHGALVDLLPINFFKLRIICIELMPENCAVLHKKGYKTVEADFLSMAPTHPLHDIIIANPPFTKNQDIDHVMHMTKFVAEGGQIVALTSTHWQFAEDKKSKAFREFLDDCSADVQELPPGMFKESGTNIPVCIISIRM